MSVIASGFQGTCLGRAIAGQFLGSHAIFHQLGSGVPVNPFAKSELLY
jgi:hypothetical protein